MWRIKEFFRSFCQWRLNALPVWTGPDVQPPLGAKTLEPNLQTTSKCVFPPPWSGEEKRPVVFSWRGAAKAGNLPGLASWRAEGGGESVWNSPGSCGSHCLMGNQKLPPPHVSRRWTQTVNAKQADQSEPIIWMWWVYPKYMRIKCTQTPTYLKLCVLKVCVL